MVSGSIVVTGSAQWTETPNVGDTYLFFAPELAPFYLPGVVQDVSGEDTVVLKVTGPFATNPSSGTKFLLLNFSLSVFATGTLI